MKIRSRERGIEEISEKRLQKDIRTKEMRA